MLKTSSENAWMWNLETRLFSRFDNCQVTVYHFLWVLWWLIFAICKKLKCVVLSSPDELNKKEKVPYLVSVNHKIKLKPREKEQIYVKKKQKKKIKAQEKPPMQINRKSNVNKKKKTEDCKNNC